MHDARNYCRPVLYIQSTQPYLYITVDADRVSCADPTEYLQRTLMVEDATHIAHLQVSFIMEKRKIGPSFCQLGDISAAAC